MKVALIERWPQLGGVCLNVGCIPSKALLHAAKVIEEAEEMSSAGMHFGKPQIDAAKLREWKNKIVGKLTGGLATLAKQRKVEVIRGTGKFVSPHEIEVATGKRRRRGASPSHTASSPRARNRSACRDLPDDPRIIDSTGALELDLPKRMLVVGGGIIGLEMATVYDALGVQGQRRRAHRRPDAGLRSRSGAAAGAPDHEALRTHHGQDQGQQDRSREGRSARDASKASRRSSRKCTTRC